MHKQMELRMEAKEMLEMVIECIDMPKLKKVVAVKMLLPFLAKIVADTENKFDDKAYEYVKEWIEKNMN